MKQRGPLSILANFSEGRGAEAGTRASARLIREQGHWLNPITLSIGDKRQGTVQPIPLTILTKHSLTHSRNRDRHRTTHWGGDPGLSLVSEVMFVTSRRNPTQQVNFEPLISGRERNDGNEIYPKFQAPVAESKGRSHTAQRRPNSRGIDGRQTRRYPFRLMSVVTIADGNADQAASSRGREVYRHRYRLGRTCPWQYYTTAAA